MAGILGEEDDFSFMSEARTRLSSLFSNQMSTNEPEKDVNQSLMFVAPKQPKKNAEQADSKKKMQILHVIAVHAYKLENGVYSTHGKLGAAILGDHEQYSYKLLLYKGKAQYVSFSYIHIDFKFQVEPELYAGFTDDSDSQWSLKFGSEEELEEFATKIAFARANSSGKILSKLVVQELMPGEKAIVNDGDSLSINYTGWLYKNFTLGEIFDDYSKSSKPLYIKLGKTELVKGLQEGLVGAGKGSKRLLVVPPFLGYGSEGLANIVPSDSTLIYTVFVKKIRTGRENSASPERRPSVPLRTQSIGEDTSIRSRGASISEQLTQVQSPKKTNAKLISRMAKMGMPTLPMHSSAAPQGSSESEPEREDYREIRSPSPLVKAAVVQSEPQIPVHDMQRKSMSPKPHSPYPQGNSVLYSSYPNPGIHGDSMPYMHALSPHPSSTFVSAVVPGLLESQMPILISETRSQNTEMRLMLGKIGDKLDSVFPKLEEIKTQQSSSISQAPYMESSTLLQNIERIVNENVQIKKENETKSTKIQELNEKICDILQRNQGFFEESTSIFEQRSDSIQVTNSQLQNKVFSLEQEKAKLASELSEAIYNNQKLQVHVQNSEKLYSEIAAKLESTESFSKESFDLVANLKIQMIEREKMKESLEDELNRYKSQNKILSLQITELDSKLKVNEQDEKSNGSKVLEELKNQLETESEKVNHWKKKHQTFQENTRQLKTRYDSQIEIVMKENKELKSLARSGQPSSDFPAEIRRAMNILYKSLNGEINETQTYIGSEVLRIALDAIRRVTMRMISDSSKLNNEEQSSPKITRSSPTPTTQTKEVLAESELPQKPIENETPFLTNSTDAESSNAEESSASKTPMDIQQVVSEEPMATELSNDLSSDKTRDATEKVNEAGDDLSEKKEKLTVTTVIKRLSPDKIFDVLYHIGLKIIACWKGIVLVLLLACFLAFVHDMEAPTSDSTTF